MGRNSKFEVPPDEISVKSMRFPDAFIEQCPPDIPFTDWIRFDLLHISKDGKTFNSHNVVSTEKQIVVAEEIKDVLNQKLVSRQINLFKKMVNEFIEQGIKMKLEPEEVELVKQTYMEMNQ